MTIEELKAISILTVVNRLDIEVDRNHKAHCLKNRDSDPSLSFNVKENLFNCFSCGTGGSNIDLVKYALNLSNKDSMQWLNNEFKRAGNHQTRPQKAQRGKAIYKTETAPRQATATNYHYIYDDLINQGDSFDNMPINAQEYFTIERKLSGQIIKAWEIKYYSEQKRKNIFKYLKDKYQEIELIESGVLGVSKKGNLYYNFYDCQYLFPFWDFKGEFFHIQGKSKNRKYVNLSKRQLLKPYGYHILSTLKPGDNVYLVEGLFDCLNLNDIGLKAIGIPGVYNFKSHYAEMLKPFNVIFIRDNDPAGEKLEKNVLNTLYNIKIKRIPLEYKDINDYLRRLKRK